MIEIQLTQGKTTRVDDMDFEKLNRHKWHASRIRNRWYATRTVHQFPFKKTIRMHNDILGISDSAQVDHIDGDSLNNCRANLRICTNAENQHNRGKNINNKSGYKGVSFDKLRGKWLAQIRINGKKINLGRFSEPESAAHAYDRAALELHGDFATLNFPHTDYKEKETLS